MIDPGTADEIGRSPSLLQAQVVERWPTRMMAYFALAERAAPNDGARPFAGVSFCSRRLTREHYFVYPSGVTG